VQAFGDALFRVGVDDGHGGGEGVGFSTVGGGEQEHPLVFGAQAAAFHQPAVGRADVPGARISGSSS
jgi:hypothetical protein